MIYIVDSLVDNIDVHIRAAIQHENVGVYIWLLFIMFFLLTKLIHHVWLLLNLFNFDHYLTLRALNMTGKLPSLVM